MVERKTERRREKGRERYEGEDFEGRHTVGMGHRGCRDTVATETN